jgi:hypothetical protein
MEKNESKHSPSPFDSAQSDVWLSHSSKSLARKSGCDSTEEHFPKCKVTLAKGEQDLVQRVNKTQYESSTN